MDIFKKVDSSSSGILSRNEFSDCLKAAKFPTDDVEMKHVLSILDKFQTDNIDYYDFIVNLTKGDLRMESQLIEDEVVRKVAGCKCKNRYLLEKMGEERYRFGDNQLKRLVRILRSTVMVRVGGGWRTLDEYLAKNDPCRAKPSPNDNSSLLSCEIITSPRFQNQLKPGQVIDTIAKFVKKSNHSLSKSQQSCYSQDKPSFNRTISFNSENFNSIDRLKKAVRPPSSQDISSIYNSEHNDDSATSSSFQGRNSTFNKSNTSGKNIFINLNSSIASNSFENETKCSKSKHFHQNNIFSEEPSDKYSKPNIHIDLTKISDINDTELQNPMINLQNLSDDQNVDSGTNNNDSSLEQTFPSIQAKVHSFSNSKISLPRNKSSLSQNSCSHTSNKSHSTSYSHSKLPKSPNIDLRRCSKIPQLCNRNSSSNSFISPPMSPNDECRVNSRDCNGFDSFSKSSSDSF